MSRGDDQMNLIGQPNLLGSWFEFNRDQTNGGVWADVSLIRGCDGAMFIRATDGSNAWAGFLQDIISGAPGGAFASKPDGARVLSPTEDGNTVTLNYELSTNIEGTTYIDDSHGSPGKLLTHLNSNRETSLTRGSYFHLEWTYCSLCSRWNHLNVVPWKWVWRMIWFMKGIGWDRLSF